MNILFVHQNMPGQYRELVQWLAAQGGHRIYFLTQRKNPAQIEGVETRIYKSHYTPKTDAYGLSKVWERDLVRFWRRSRSKIRRDSSRI